MGSWPGIVALEVAVALVILCRTVEGRPDTRVGPGILYDRGVVYKLKRIPGSSALYNFVPLTPSGARSPPPVTLMLKH